MAFEIKVPSPGESITQVQVAKWLVEEGSEVEKDQEVVEIDSDKATFPLVAPGDGIIKILVREGETIPVGSVIATVDPVTLKGKKAPAGEQAAAKKTILSPLAQKMAAENNLDKEEVVSLFGGKRVTKKDIESFIKDRKDGKKPLKIKGSRDSERRKLSMLRLKLAERLVAVKNETAMLTTFNEINMRALLEIKSKYNDAFKEKFGVSIGFMSFFAKAVTLAMKDFPQVNSMIDGDELVTPSYVDIGIAVSAPKGLVVPVIRNAEMMSLGELEIRIKELAVKARENRITIDDMQGGTFTITNGGVFGSLMSTPILNPPQSAILGMHKVMDRPVAVKGNVVIHPMMYVALSYDHRVIDGRESVGFLVKVKEYVEDPLTMLTGGEDPVQMLLDL